VGGQTVKAKANEIVLKLGVNFKCSNGWLQHFKESRNITWHSVSKSRHGFSTEVARKCESQYALKDVFNVEKTTLFYNTQPKITPLLKGEKCQGGKWYKDCVTVLLCCNADASKKDPYINFWKV
jgi:hypothetical protein